MASGNLKGPLGPLMLALLVGVAIFMVFALDSPELSERFQRPEGFYDRTLEKAGLALAFAAAVTVMVWLVRKFIK